MGEIPGAVVAAPVGADDLESVSEKIGKLAVAAERLEESGDLSLGDGCGAILGLGVAAAAHGPPGGEPDADDGGDQERTKAGREWLRHRALLERL